MEKIICSSQIPRGAAGDTLQGPGGGGGGDTLQGPSGKHRGWLGGRGSRENTAKKLYCGFHGKIWVRQGKQAGLNNFSGLWGTGAVPSCLVPGPGVIRTGEWWPGVREPTRGGGWGAGSGLVGLRVKGLLELFTVSGNELDLGGVVPHEAPQVKASE